jgi:hypothetical protein
VEGATMPFPQPSRVKQADHQDEFSLLIVVIGIIPALMALRYNRIANTE